MRLRGTAVAGSLVLVFFAAGVAAQPIVDANQRYRADLEADYYTVSDFVSSQMSRSFGFFAGLGWQICPTVLDALKGPRVEIGFGAGADLMKVDDVNALEFKALEKGGNLDIPSTMPFPFPVWHLKAGLLKGVDFGIRGGSIPRLELDGGKFSFVNKSLGMELRCQAVHGKSLPTVTVCATWDKLQGDLYATTDLNQQAAYEDGGVLYIGTLSGTALYYTCWNVRSFGLKMTVGKGFGVLYPFAGLGFQRNAGSVRSALSVRGTETLTDPVLNSTSQTLEMDLSSACRPKVVESKILAGFDLGSAFYWTNLMETNGKDVAVSTGFRIQI